MGVCVSVCVYEDSAAPQKGDTAPAPRWTLRTLTTGAQTQWHPNQQLVTAPKQKQPKYSPADDTQCGPPV